jgi:hypothetical protein
MSYDKSRSNDPKSTDSEQSSDDYVSVSQVWDSIVAAMDSKGYSIRPELGGLFGGHNVYVQARNFDIAGVTPPASFHYRRRIGLDDMPRLRRTFIDTVNALKAEAANKYELKVLNDLMTSFLDKPGDVRTPLFMQSFITNAFQAAEDTTRIGTLSGKPGCFKVVPQIEWFPEALQNFNARNLLTLLPDAEADQFMLLLGRAAVGASHTKTAEGVIEHTSRSYALIVGNEAGLGKSTLMNYILSAMTKLGYNVTNIPINETKFGWGPVAQADISYIDDLTAADQKRLISDPRVKSIASSNTLKVEEKGMPAQDIRATTVMFGCTNMHDTTHYIGMDSGSISRVNFLDSYSSNDLKRVWGTHRDFRTKNFWEETAVEFGVSVDCLAAYLVARSAEYFLDVIGYLIDENGWLEKSTEKEPVLELVTKENRKLFRIDTNLRHVEELTTVASHAVALAIAFAKPKEQQLLLDEVETLALSADILLPVVRMFATKKEKFEGVLANLELTRADRSCRRYIATKLKAMEGLGERQTSDQAFTTIINELQSVDAIKYPQKQTHYMSTWCVNRREIRYRVAQYEHLAQVEELPEVLEVLVAEIRQGFKSIR